MRPARAQGASAEVRRYGFAAAVTLTALLVTIGLAHLIEDIPLLLLLAAVMASALRGGTGPGLLATGLAALSVVIGTHLLRSPLELARISPWAEVIRLATFVAVAGGISLMAGARERAESQRDALLVSEKAARAEAESANLAKNEFLATVSHELRNPLAAIQAWASLLRRGVMDAGRHRAAVEAIERNAKLQARLIDDLLDVSRIVTGQLRLDTRGLDLRRIVEAAVETARPSAEAKAVGLRLTLERSAAIVEGDAERLEQVVWNLLSNAIKFTPEGGRVWVRLRRVEPHAELRVSDTGCGIDPVLLPHVFDRFWQAEAGLGRAKGGLGLGLAIVRHLVELHGGAVSAHSRGREHGATFEVRLPLVAADARGLAVPETPRQSALPPLPSRLLKGVPVLLVDDEADATEATAALLSACGAEVRIARSAPEALGVLDAWAPAVVVSDIEMPGEDGYMLIHKIRERGSTASGNVPAIALTAYGRADDRQRALAAGFQAHITKAGDPELLVATIADLARAR
ncbi:MAG TPA: hybrid sensor histidine kinase/response regulator [Candidatus Binatia bacterium]|nr:hybrid sensor histidine kinase/response regulator [Candidatus Binatia bacterium]